MKKRKSVQIWIMNYVSDKKVNTEIICGSD